MTNTCSCHHTQADARPTDVLKQEHRVIERVLDATEQMLEQPTIDKAFMLSVIDFVRNFADGCHHHKEEDALFPMLEQAGVPREGGPIGCMLSEHEMGRLLIRTISESLDPAVAGRAEAIQAVQQAARQYISLLRMHINKEDTVLFAVADHVLDKQHQTELMASLDRTELIENEAGKHERYVALADRLYKQAFSSGRAPSTVVSHAS